jgi:hypothetical protein
LTARTSNPFVFQDINSAEKPLFPLSTEKGQELANERRASAFRFMKVSCKPSLLRKRHGKIKEINSGRKVVNDFLNGFFIGRLYFNV